MRNGSPNFLSLSSLFSFSFSSILPSHQTLLYLPRIRRHIRLSSSPSLPSFIFITRPYKAPQPPNFNTLSLSHFLERLFWPSLFLNVAVHRVRIVDVPLRDPLRLLAQTPPESWKKRKRERDLLGSGMNSNDTLPVLRDVWVKKLCNIVCKTFFYKRIKYQGKKSCINLYYNYIIVILYIKLSVAYVNVKVIVFKFLKRQINS